MLFKKKISFSVVPILVTFISFGCFGISKTFPEKKFFLVETGFSGPNFYPPKGSALKVRRFSISQKFEGKELVYRKDDVSYESDYYNLFFIPPATNLKEEILKGLIQLKLFEWDANSNTKIEPTHYLEANVRSLYGDFRNSPKAVMEIEFLFYIEVDGNTKILLRKTYEKAAPIGKKEPEALVLGWNEALGQIGKELETDLRDKIK
ncbi:ABC-type transport auxiliary lipoprotein, LBF_0736 family [Leptospira ilyithenensis]|uniref:ABC-type transport auxiliary lipoprotein component domain-containing protein n=1 Tax=Leptospira ilyithenensis TaxID=2484901 RepID=A0A4R9LNI9_9LEPT|nr:hypothetical protein [Leptospira ilyithenensis]TGN07032.1 hypothetical protein EHS11_18080 [Leptospira ilyithenensis]